MRPKDNIKGIHAQDDRVVVVAGLSHLGLLRGVIYELAKSPSGKWQIAHRTRIEENAEASVADASGGVIIATSKSLLRYQDRALVRFHTRVLPYDHAGTRQSHGVGQSRLR